MFPSDHPLKWLPQPGHGKKIPGGSITCQQWDMEQMGNRTRIVVQIVIDVENNTYQQFRRGMTPEEPGSED